MVRATPLVPFASLTHPTGVGGSPSAPGPWPAPAKLNLFLRITGRRADGYHELQTLFQLLDWGDELHIGIDRSGAIVRGRDLDGVPAEADLSLRAARLLQQACGIARGARITVTKRIPIGGGLGGASSNAATVLRVLNSLWDCGLSVDELADLGLRLGADVPLFVRGRSAWGEGVGERLQAVALGERHYVLVLTGVAVATAELFQEPALRRDAPPVARGAVPDLQAAAALGNAFEAVVYARYPELARLARELRTWGTPRLSGTGGTLFLAMPAAADARRVTSILKSRYNVRAVGGVDESPLLERLARE